MRKTLYKVKLGLIYVGNLLYLRGNFFGTASPELIFLNQYEENKLNRYDVIIRMLFIDFLLGKNTIGKTLYHNMQQHRAGDNGKDKKDFLEKENSINKIVTKIQKHGIRGYKKNSYIRLNKSDKLCDGSHRLAISLYFNIPQIRYTRSQIRDVKYGFETLDFLSDEEKSLIVKTEKSILEGINPTKILNEILKSQSQQFGRGTFYQSFEDIDLDGQRPTLKRFEIYELNKFLSKNMTVLDIGSNCGFLALYISKFVKQIDGIEYNKSLTDISNITKLLLKIDNAKFINGDFNKVKIEKKYDLILSFAVHYWIGMEINQYANELKKLLNKQGYILFESQNILKEDKDWENKINAFINAGFHMINSGELCDDGKINRKFTLFQKLK